MDVAPYRWRMFFAALAAALCLTALLWLLFPPLYLTNDDITIRRAIEGTAIPGQPATGFVLMTHSALGWTIAWVQRLVPTVPLWDLAVVGVLIWALGTLFAIVLTTLGPGWLTRLLGVGAMLVVVMPLLGGVQFTISGTLGGGAAVAVAAVEVGSATKPRRSVLVMSLVLLLAALLVRPMGAAAGAIATTLFLTPNVMLDRHTRRAQRGHLAVGVGTVLTLFVLALYLDGALYGFSKDWNAYYRYNWIGAELVEWGGDLPPPDVASVRTAANWTENDWRMLQGSWGVDPAVHGVERVERAYEARRVRLGWNGWTTWAIGRLQAIDRSALRAIVSGSLVVLTLIVTIGATHATRDGVRNVALAVLLFGALCVGIGAAFKELPFRLLGPLQACLLTTVLIIVGRCRRATWPILAVATASLILTILAYQVRGVVSALAADRQHSEQVQQEVDAVRKLAPSLLVLQSDSFPSEHWWKPFRQPTTRLDAIQLGMNNQSPLLQKYLSSTGRQPLLRAICEDPSILIISEPGRLQLVTNYLLEHFKLGVDWTEVYSGSFRAWRCERKDGI